MCICERCARVYDPTDWDKSATSCPVCSLAGKVAAAAYRAVPQPVPVTAAYECLVCGEMWGASEIGPEGKCPLCRYRLGVARRHATDPDAERPVPPAPLVKGGQGRENDDNTPDVIMLFTVGVAGLLLGAGLLAVVMYVVRALT